MKKNIRLNKYRLRNQFAYWSILPTVLLILTVFAFPVFFNIIISFTNMDSDFDFINSDYVGISNYVNEFKDRDFQKTLLQNIWWTVAVLAFSLIIGLALATFLQDHKLGKFFLNIWLIPWAMPEVIAAIMWVLILHPDFGPLNYLLINLHIISKPLPWLTSVNFAMWGVIIVGVWKIFPFHMAMVYAGLQTFPEELRDAAKVDGANGWQLFWYVQLPWIRPVISIVSLLGFIWIFNWFSLLYTMTKGGPGDATKILPIHIYQKALKFFHFSEASTLSVITLIFMVPLIIIYIQYQLGRRNR